MKPQDGTLTHPAISSRQSWIMVVGKKADRERVGPFFCPLDTEHFAGEIVPWLGEQGCTSFVAHEVWMSEEAFLSIPADFSMPTPAAPAEPIAPVGEQGSAVVVKGGVA